MLLRAADLLERKQMLLDGVDAAALLATPELLEDDDDRWEGLDKGPDAAYFEALEAYVEVCADARCDKRFTQTWQRHAAAIFAEALMELVATYRSSRPLHATTAVAESTEVDISANMALLEQQAQAQIQVDEVAATVKAEVSAFGEVPPRSPCPIGRDETLNVLTVITKATTVEATSVSPLKMLNMPEQPAPRPLSHGDEAHVPEAATTEPAATANVIVADAKSARAAIAKVAAAKAARPEVSVAEVAAAEAVVAEATVAKATVAEGAAFGAAASDAAATDAASSQTAEQAAAAAAAAAAESPQKPPAPADAPAATAASAVAAPSSAPMVLPTSGCNSSTGTATVSLAMGAATGTEGGKSR